MLFNTKKEHIIQILEKDFHLFVITLQEEIRYDGKLNVIHFRGYALNVSDSYIINTSPIIEMLCDTVYDESLNYLKSIFIVDFKVSSSRYMNKGYGSLIMKELISYSKELKVKHISGQLSFVDIDEEYGNRRDMLHHFYKKHGFRIDNNNLILEL